jgi:enoyl-CoA hydratase/carnithine racemase
MELQHLKWEEPEDGLVLVTFSREDRLNAFNQQTLREINDVIDAVKADDRYRVLIFTGTGRAFSAGADIEMFERQVWTAPGRVLPFEWVKNRFGFVSNLETLYKPAIAAINGVAVGEGIELALGCDFRIASERARLGFVEGNIGLIPASEGSSRLVKLLGLLRAKELVLGGNLLTAQEAYQAGLVTKVVPHEQLMDEALALARSLKAKAPLALGMAKAVLHAAADSSVQAANLTEMLAQAFLMRTQDYQEGVQAFREKRQPQFQGA